MHVMEKHEKIPKEREYQDNKSLVFREKRYTYTQAKNYLTMGKLNIKSEECYKMDFLFCKFIID